MSDLESYLIGEGRYTKIGDDMTWPSYDQHEAEWMQRYASKECIVRERFVTASIISAYSNLIALPQKKRNAICEALKNAKPALAKDNPPEIFEGTKEALNKLGVKKEEIDLSDPENHSGGVFYDD